MVVSQGREQDDPCYGNADLLWMKQIFDSVTPKPGFEELRFQVRLEKDGNTVCLRKTSFGS